MILGQLVVAPVSQTLAVLERQDIQLDWDAFHFGTLLLVFFAARQLAWPPLLTIAVLSVGVALCYPCAIRRHPPGAAGPSAYTGLDELIENVGLAWACLGRFQHRDLIAELGPLRSRMPSPG